VQAEAPFLCLIRHSDVFQSLSADRFTKMEAIKDLCTRKDVLCDYLFLNEAKRESGAGRPPGP